MRKKSTGLSLLSLCLLLLAGCGGGGENIFGGAAFVKVQANPDLIDVGDSTFVVVDVEDVNDPSIFLKVRFPTGLEYIEGSSFLRVDGEDFERDPDVVFTSSTDNKSYLIYFLSKEEMNDKSKTRISFDLVGLSRVSKGDIEVDADIDDPNKPNTREFDTALPKFDEEASDEVRVR